jgi:hypothetical protein
MNFQNIFEELNSLYEELPAKEASVAKEDVEEVEEGLLDAVKGAASGFVSGLKEDADEDEEVMIDDEPIIDDEAGNDDEEPVKKQVVIECANCGALVIKTESELAFDEDADLVNVDEACQYCEAKEGYKVIGAVEPYSVEVAPVDESLTELFGFGKNKKNKQEEQPQEEQPVETPNKVPNGYVVGTKEKIGSSFTWTDMMCTVYRDYDSAKRAADVKNSGAPSTRKYEPLSCSSAKAIFGKHAVFVEH